MEWVYLMHTTYFNRRTRFKCHKHKSNLYKKLYISLRNNLMNNTIISDHARYMFITLYITI